jgi:hypothetical protein
VFARLIPALLLLLAMTAGCRSGEHEGPAPATDPEARDSVIALMRVADLTAFEDAFSGALAREHDRTTRTEQLATDGRVLAFREHTLRQSATNGLAGRALLRADSSGSFHFGHFDAIVSTDRRDAAAVNPVPLFLPSEPAYLTARERDAYTYRMAPDTVIAGRPVRVAEAEALPGSRQPVIRRARYYVDAATGRLAGIEIDRVEAALLFGEASLLRILLQHGPAGEPLPHYVAFETEVKALLADPRRFRFTEAYSGF